MVHGQPPRCIEYIEQGIRVDTHTWDSWLHRVVLLRCTIALDVCYGTSDDKLDQLYGIYDVHLLPLHASTTVTQRVQILGYSQARRCAISVDEW